jgi:alpha-galactosidase/6-phospho-beta-glucosidase family protein
VNWFHSCLICNIEGLTTDVSRRYFCAMPTSIAMPDFPGRTVECAVTVAKDSVLPLPLKPITPPIRAISQLLRASEELLIEAAMTHSRSKAIDALAINPMCPSFEQARGAVECMIDQVGLNLR